MRSATYNEPRLQSAFVRVGVLLGAPIAVDPARPNADGGATCLNDPPDYPLYSVRKRCPRCGAAYVGRSIAPQYDDDDAFTHRCDACTTRVEAAAAALQRQYALEREAANARAVRRTGPYSQARRARRGKDVLDD